jgi:hypothetical protein
MVEAWGLRVLFRPLPPKPIWLNLARKLRLPMLTVATGESKLVGRQSV